MNSACFLRISAPGKKNLNCCGFPLDEQLKVAVLYSGGKDSTMSLYHALKSGWEVAALIAVKPKSMDAYLWHYATVEWTKLSSEALGIPHIFIMCNGIGPDEETRELEGLLRNMKIDAVLMGGVGLQKTQIRAVRRVAEKYGIKVILPHEGLDHYQLFKEAVQSGFDIRITSVAAMGLGPEWLGRKIDFESLELLKRMSEEYGFHIGFEGGHAETFVVDGPIFTRRVEFLSAQKVWDPKTESGYLDVREAVLAPK